MYQEAERSQENLAKVVEKYYSVHGVVNFSIVNKSALVNKIFPSWDIELRGFESKRADKSDFSVVLGNHMSPRPYCLIMDDKFHIKEDYLYCSDFHKYARWRLEMAGFEKNSMEVCISANPFAWLLISDYIVNPLIWFKMNERGYAIVHGAGVVKDDKAYIFAGRGAAGKSTIALNLVERGFKLLGDHFVILHKDAVLSYLTPLHIAGFNLSPFIKQRMELKHKALFRLDQLLNKATGLQFGTKISPKTMLPNLVEDRAQLHSIFLLLPRESFKAEKINKEELVAHLAYNQKLESIPFIKYLMEYSYLFPQSNMATHWARHEQNLNQALSTAEALYRVEVPLRYNSETLENIFQLVG